MTNKPNSTAQTNELNLTAQTNELNSTAQTGTLEDQAPHNHARLTLRVGVTGHRPNNLQSMDERVLRGQIRMALEFLRKTIDAVHEKAGSLYRSEAPVLRIISPLAEGADRLVAEVGQALNGSNELDCPLPFYQEEYEKDFTPGASLVQFRKLLKTARSVLELDGSKETSDYRQQSYEAVGRMVLSHADVMIAIWNGEPGLRGGTSQIIEEAERLSIPLIWIDSRAPHPVSMKLGDKTWVAWAEGTAVLANKLEALLMPPPPAVSVVLPEHGKKAKRDLREAFFSETEPRWDAGFIWRHFRDLVAFKMPATPQSPHEPLPEPAGKQIDTALGGHYDRSDRLANHYSNAYRSAFVLNYLMIACVVLVAFLGFAWHEHKWTSTSLGVAELVMISAVILIALVGMGRRWHDRWIDYRLLAEYLRQARFLMALGRVSVSVQRVPAHISYGDPNNSWMYWHLRALVRDAGMVRARFDSSYLEAVRNFIMEEGIKGQIDYHELSAGRFDRITHRLHRIGIILFIIAFGATAAHFFVHEKVWTISLATISIVGPAVGGALAAIRSQGEFERLTKRSWAMSSQLRRLYDELKALKFRDGGLASLSLADLGVRSAQLMIEEVLDWRIVVQEKPLDLS